MKCSPEEENLSRNSTVCCAQATPDTDSQVLWRMLMSDKDLTIAKMNMFKKIDEDVVNFIAELESIYKKIK